MGQMVEKLGPKGTAEAFIKASEYFEANKGNEKEEERPKPMTAAEWKKVLEEDDAEGEEEDFMEGEEEEGDVEGDDDDDGEPDAKKQRTGWPCDGAQVSPKLHGGLPCVFMAPGPPALAVKGAAGVLTLARLLDRQWHIKYYIGQNQTGRQRAQGVQVATSLGLGED